MRRLRIAKLKLKKLWLDAQIYYYEQRLWLNQWQINKLENWKMRYESRQFLQGDNDE